MECNWLNLMNFLKMILISKEIEKVYHMKKQKLFNKLVEENVLNLRV